MTKDEIIKALRDMAKYPTVTLPRDCEALRAAADLLAQPEQKRPQNCGRGYCSCIECVMEPAPVQEPVAWADMGTCDVDNDAGLSWTPGHFHTTPLYTTPPQRTWVGLTYEEKDELRYSHMTSAEFIDAIEAELKEKNT
jgi:hypothetical protein